MGIAFPLTPAPEKQKSSALARSGFFPFPRFSQSSRPANGRSFRFGKTAGIHPRSPSKAWLSSGCTGSAPLHDRLAAGTQRASPLSIAAVHHRDAGTGCTRSRSNGQNKSGQLSSFDYGWSPLLWPLCFFGKLCITLDLPAGYFDPYADLRFLCECLIQFHQFCHTVRFCESLNRESIRLHHSAVVVLMGTAQLRRHGNFIIQVCETII